MLPVTIVNVKIDNNICQDNTHTYLQFSQRLHFTDRFMQRALHSHPASTSHRTRTHIHITHTQTHLVSLIILAWQRWRGAIARRLRRRDLRTVRSRDLQRKHVNNNNNNNSSILCQTTRSLAGQMQHWARRWWPHCATSTRDRDQSTNTPNCAPLHTCFDSTSNLDLSTLSVGDGPSECGTTLSCAASLV
jgi:hypothetical protein